MIPLSNLVVTTYYTVSDSNKPPISRSSDLTPMITTKRS